MTQWTYHFPNFNGDAPDGVTEDTHFIEWHFDDEGYWRTADWPRWYKNYEYRYRPRANTEVCKITGKPYVEKTVAPLPATYEQVVAWCEANDRPVPARPVDHEAFRGVLSAYMGMECCGEMSSNDKQVIDDLIAAVKAIISDPVLMEAIKE